MEFATDTIYSYSGLERVSTLLRHKAIFEDNIYNPFDAQTDQFDYLQINQAKSYLEKG